MPIEYVDNSSPWALRIRNANLYFNEWNSRFRCDLLTEYIRGFQWKFKKDFNSFAYNPYTLNLFYSTIKIKMAGFLFQKPGYVITPAPGNGGNWDMDLAMQSAGIKQDTLNTIIQNPNMNFTKHIKRAAKDSFSRFGLIEVGYAADWRNPQAEIPELKSWEDCDIPEEKDKIVKPNEVPINERFFIKRINPKRFRVSISDAIDLKDHEWCGYYDFMYERELKNTKGIDFPDDYSGGMTSADFNTGILGDSFNTRSSLLKIGGNDSKICKVWHIFDMVSGQRLLLLDNYCEKPLWSQDMERLPLIDNRWDEDDEGFYPVPPAFQWVSQQDEINEAREQTRSYRRRFTRKFQYIQDTVDDLEAQKFASGPDGVLIKVKVKDAISPIQNPEQGPTAENALLLAKDDFNTISGTSAEARGQNADRETATAAKIVDARAAIRESAEQLDFSNFIELIGREILAQAKEKLVEGLWVKDSSGAVQDFASLMQARGPVYKWIKAQDLMDGYDETIICDIQNQTPQAQASQNQAFAQFLTYVHNFPEIALDPDLIREAAYRCGYKNEKIIQKMQKTAVMIMAQKAAQAGNPDGTGQSIQEEQGQNANNIAAKQIQGIDPNNPAAAAQDQIEQIM